MPNFNLIDNGDSGLSVRTTLNGVISFVNTGITSGSSYTYITENTTPGSEELLIDVNDGYNQSQQQMGKDYYSTKVYIPDNFISSFYMDPDGITFSPGNVLRYDDLDDGFVSQIKQYGNGMEFTSQNGVTQTFYNQGYNQIEMMTTNNIDYTNGFQSQLQGNSIYSSGPTISLNNSQSLDKALIELRSDNQTIANTGLNVTKVSQGKVTDGVITAGIPNLGYASQTITFYQNTTTGIGTGYDVTITFDVNGYIDYIDGYSYGLNYLPGDVIYSTDPGNGPIQIDVQDTDSSEILLTAVDANSHPKSGSNTFSIKPRITSQFVTDGFFKYNDTELTDTHFKVKIADGSVGSQTQVNFDNTAPQIDFSVNDGINPLKGIKLNNITISFIGIPSYDDDTDAGTNGLNTGDLYQTTGGGASPLNVAGILMLKQ